MDLKGANVDFPVVALGVAFKVVEDVPGTETEGGMISAGFSTVVWVLTSTSSIVTADFLPLELARPRPLRWGLDFLVGRFCSSSSSSTSSMIYEDLVLCCPDDGC